MARVALIKLFTGLNLGVSQLSGELQAAGHDSRLIYFKDFLAVPIEDSKRYLMSDYPGINVAARGREYIWNCYRPFSDKEYELLFEALDELQPNLIGISLTSLPLKPAAELTRTIKARYPNTPVIWGGPGPTLEPEFCLDHADMVCVNEGERLIVELANRLDAGADVADIPGLWLRRADGSRVRNTPGPLLELNDLAMPDFAPERTIHINDGKIRRDLYPPNLGSQYIIMTQRGCPFSCSFCIESVYQDMFGKKNHLRRRSVDLVIQEIVEARKRMPFLKQIMFYDDVFTVNPRWMSEFAARYKAEVGLPFWCYTYPTTSKREELLMLKDAGLHSITMGIQSGSEEILKNNFNRPVVQSKTLEAAQTIVETGVEAYFDLITKVQFEKESDCRQTFEFLLRLPLGMKTVGFGVMTMFPGYGYTKKVAAEGAELTLGQKDYEYFHKLYLLTRTNLPRRVVKAVGNSRLARRYPQLIDRLLPENLPSFFLIDDDYAYSSEVLNLPHAQAVIPGGRLDSGLAA